MEPLYIFKSEFFNNLKKFTVPDFNKSHDVYMLTRIDINTIKKDKLNRIRCEVKDYYIVCNNEVRRTRSNEIMLDDYNYDYFLKKFNEMEKI